QTARHVETRSVAPWHIVSKAEGDWCIKHFPRCCREMDLSPGVGAGADWAKKARRNRHSIERDCTNCRRGDRHIYIHRSRTAAVRRNHIVRRPLREGGNQPHRWSTVDWELDSTWRQLDDKDRVIGGNLGRLSQGGFQELTAVERGDLVAVDEDARIIGGGQEPVIVTSRTRLAVEAQCRHREEVGTPCRDRR